jgi:peptide chain release factor 3
VSDLKEISRRRTFAIISHPDAGKTTLTEKLLLYGGALHLAGSVTARKKQRETASDWMELERKRGISISSTVLQFDYQGYHINLLDTPGHRDFSEDTYRVLTAVDAVVMVIDAAKGIETQTRKLFEVCRQRRVPIFTFMNKLDRPTMEPFELIDQLESILQIHAFPMNWPLGTGIDFKGVYDRMKKEAHFFERTVGGAYRAPVSIHDLSDASVKERLDSDIYTKVIEELEILDSAQGALDAEEVLAGDMTPVFFGSASNNFGVQLMLEGFMKYSAPPAARKSQNGLVPVDSKSFSGFIFKIQGNMDPLHRDRIAFLRICSGKFTRDMMVTHSRTGKKVKLSNSHKLFGQEREIVNEGYPGDIIGLVGHDSFGIGDTFTEDPSIVYHEIPRFPPECFAYIVNPTPGKYKAFRKGLEQLLCEGVVQSFQVKHSLKGPLLAAVGPLQFEVVQYRLQSEYGAESQLDKAGWEMLRWVDSKWTSQDLEPLLPFGSGMAEDDAGQLVILFPNIWSLRSFTDKNPAIKLYEISPLHQMPSEV